MRGERVGLVLLRFHLRAGARVALRTLVPMAMVLVGAVVLYGSPAVLVGAVAAVLFPPIPSLGPALLASGLCFGVARSTSRRLTLGLGGWIRHLPASGSAHRRAATAGVVMVLLPVLMLVLAGGVAVLSSRPATTLPRLLGLPLVAWAMASAALRKGWPRWLGACGAICAWSGTWWGPILAAPLVFGSEAPAGPLDVGASAHGRRWSLTRIARRGGGATGAEAFWMAVTLRAIGHRVVGCWMTSALAVLPTLLFLRNNVLTPGQEEGAVRLGGLAAAVLAIAALAEALVRRRPPWPWARSLPWSARRRIVLDAIALGLLALPGLSVALVAPGAVPSLLAALPWLALRGAAEIRRAPGHQGGTSRLLLEGGLVAGLVAVFPAVAWVLLVATPAALVLAAERERRHEIGRWHELQHVATGDPLSWSGS